MRSVRTMMMAAVLVPLPSVAADRFAAAPGTWELSVEVKLTEAGAALLQAQAERMRRQLRGDLAGPSAAENQPSARRESTLTRTMCIAAEAENLEGLLARDDCQLLKLTTDDRSQQLRAECPEESGSHLLDLRIDTRSRKSLQGKLEILDGDGNRLGEGTVRGDWVSSRCAAQSRPFSFQFGESEPESRGP